MTDKIMINPLWQKVRLPFDYNNPTSHETLYFYDQPILWVSNYRTMDNKDDWYLGQILDDGGTPESNWRLDMFVPITPECIALIKTNKLELHTAFTKVEHVWLTLSGHQKSKLLFSGESKYLWAHTTWQAEPSQLLDEHLPDAGIFLEPMQKAANLREENK
jgi:hypothetical protein